MAFIPDEAVKQAHSIKPSAFILYTYYCMRADREGRCYPKLRTAAADLEMQYSYASRMRAELTRAGWISVDGEDTICLLGFANNANKVANNATENCEISNTELRITQTEVAKSANINCVIRNSPYKDEPAQLTSPINQPNEPEEPNRIVESADADPTASRAAQSRQVFDFWREHLEHPQAIFKGKRERAVLSRLRDGYTLEQIKMAIKGCRLTPHNMGDNDRHQRFDDLELICRDGTNLERFISIAEAKGLRAGNLLPMPMPKEPERCGRCNDGYEMIYNFKTDLDEPRACRYCSPARRANAS